MDGSDDQAEVRRRRVGKRTWGIGAGAVGVVLAVVVGTLVLGDDPEGVAEPHACRASALKGASASGRPATESADSVPGRPATESAPPASAAHASESAPPASDRTAPEGHADFDGDGNPDLAFGSGGSVEGGSGGGSIEVAYGTGDGTRVGRCQYLTQDDPGIPGNNRDEAFFGTDVVARDLDGDGYTDLASAVFDWKPSVIIVWGSADGLASATRVPGTDTSHVAWDNDPSLDEQLAAGDFDGDRHPDLVFGLGSDKGLLKGPFRRDGTPAGTDRVPAPRRPAPEVADANYGDLVAGDLDGDGIDDLVSFHNADPDPEGPWSEQVRPVSYLQGGRDGFTQPRGVRLPDARTGAVADVDGDGFGDLVLTPRGGDASRSSVTVVYGSESGPGGRTTTVDRDTPGVPGEEPQDEDAVLAPLDVGDVNGDGYADVVAGAPRWDVYGKPGPEQVLFLAGGPDGLGGAGALLLDGSGFGTDPDGRADFGTSLGLTDLDGDGHADLVVTAPGSDTIDGAAWVLPGTAGGPATEGVIRLSADAFDDTEGLGLLLGGAGIAR